MDASRTTCILPALPVLPFGGKILFMTLKIYQHINGTVQFQTRSGPHIDRFNTFSKQYAISMDIDIGAIMYETR